MPTVEFTVPQTNVNDEFVRLVEWNVEDESAVKKGMTLVTIETSKAAEEVECPIDGYVRQLATEGSSVKVGQVIAVLADSPNELPPSKAPEPSATVVRATDEARRLAEQHGIDLGTLKVRGIVTGRHVMAAVGAHGKPEQTAPDPIEFDASKGVPLTEAQKAGAQAVLRSRQETATTYILGEADVTRAEQDLERMIDEEGILVTLTDLAICHTAAALSEHPRLNATLRDDFVVMNEDINIGVAVEADGTLHLPVIAHADTLSLGNICEKRQEIVMALFRGTPVKSGSPATCGLTVLEQTGLTHQIPIVFPGHGMIIGFGPIRDAVAFDGEGRPIRRRVVGITVSYDHRFITGFQAANFLQAVATRFATDPENER